MSSVCNYSTVMEALFTTVESGLEDKKSEIVKRTSWGGKEHRQVVAVSKICLAAAC